MKCLSVLVAAALFSSAPAALAQATNPPLGITSPLGIGPAAPVAPVGVPMGATQLATPGVSSALPGVVPQSAITGSNSACGGSAALTTGISDPTALFDAGMSSGTASGTCTTGGVSAGSAAASASSPAGMGGLAAVGRVGVPMGSTELDAGGLSPLPPTTTLTISPFGTTSSSSSTLMTSPLTGALPLSSATVPNSSPSPLQTLSGTACTGMPGNINSTGISAGTSAGIC